MLAQALMAEILQQPYEDSEEPVAWGLEPGEGAATRQAFDDVDDYRHWSESSPQYKDGTTVPGMEGWSRTVRVMRVDPSDLGQILLMETGVKRITVTVEHNSVAVAEMTALKTGPSSASSITEGDPGVEE